MLKDQLERNILARELERKGDFEEAIKLYEQNISENFEGNFSYDRLTIIYRKLNKRNDEIRILKKAVYVFEYIVHYKRSDRIKKLQRFKDELKKVLTK